MHTDTLCFCSDVIDVSVRLGSGATLLGQWCPISQKTWGTSDPVTWSITAQDRNLESRDAVTGTYMVPLLTLCMSCVPFIY